MRDHPNETLFFTPPARTWPRLETDQAGRVVVVTRTRDRPLLLARACETVLAQTYRDWRMVVVNDGGHAPDVEAVLARYRPLFADRLHVIHNPSSLGMQAAANAGLSVVSGEFAVILDDDDTWHPEFLREAVAVLTDAGNAWMGGVVCHVRLVRERIENGLILFESDADFNSWMRVVRLDRVMAENPIPPCAFLFRRAVLNAIGAFNESLTVLGDWEFLLRLLSVTEIGVLEKPLAHYHHRTNLQGTPYANSQGSRVHDREDAAIRNAALRKCFADPSASAGLAITAGRSLLGIRRAIETATREVAGLGQQLDQWQARQLDMSRFEACLDERFEQVRRHETLLVQQHDCLHRMEEHLLNLAERYHAHAGLMESRLAQIDEIHLWLGILTWPLRIVWRPLRALLVRMR